MSELAVRTETEVAADTVVALMKAGLLPKTAETVLAASRVLGLHPADMREADERWSRRRPVEQRPIYEPPPPRPHTNGYRPEAKLPTAPPPSSARCSGCMKDKHLCDFDGFAQCNDCRRRERERKQRRRSELDTSRKRLMKVVARNVAVRARDGALELCCRRCGKLILSGDEVVGEMSHAGCEET